MSPDYTTPVRDGRLVIGPSGLPGRFDSHLTDCPFVFSANGRQGMTYVGWDGTGYQTALAWKDHGQWSDGRLILCREEGHELRRYNAALTSIARDNNLWSDGELRKFGGWYYGTYHAYPSAGYEAGPGSIGFARSRDLLSWQDTGCVLRPDDGAPWERGGLYKSWLLEHDGMFYLFYNAKNVGRWPWTEQTGLATSSDLTNWRRHPGNPVLAAGAPGDFDEFFASDPCVLRDGAFWVMFYFGLAADGHAREGYATSRDLTTWVKSKEVLLDVGQPGSVDSLHAHKPAVICRDGRLEHYYCAVARQEPVIIAGQVQNERRGIARAVSKGARSAS